ncbi:uncharacterized protein LOC108734694 [Agrilus planipennis]|uniref:Uncharacterized protein LOC108734694 n=1 Tax=Agrilus planipennis TaxID=224129 RepID=A0A1W4WD02_AGRPL|nr:uncharacterized protein LOC108734694 [Agrilus planipennis]
MEKLFLFEIIIETINFKLNPAPHRDDIIIYISLGDIFFLKSFYSAFSQLEVQQIPTTPTIEYNTGKSYIFTYPVEKFRNVLKENPLLLTFYEENSAVGFAALPWHDAFIYMVDENITYSTINSPPVCYTDEVDIMRGSKRIGTTHVFVRLTCFGKSLSTLFQVAEVPNTLQARQFFFRGMGREIVFQAQRYGLGASSEIIPVAPLFNSPHGVGDEDSFETVLNESKASQFSYFKGNRKSVGGVDRYNIQNLTMKDFQNCLCKNPDCPGNASFRQFGLDILKQNKRKRITRSSDDDIPIDHGLTHVTGSIEGYGPCSSYRRPKQLQQSFIPKDANKHKCLRGGSPLRLKGGGNEKIEFKERKPFNFEQLASFGLEDPATTCKSLLNEFDKCIESFKDTIGPCKTATCSYAPNVFQKKCICPSSIRNRMLNSGNSQESLTFEIDEPQKPICKKKSENQEPTTKASDPEFSVPKVSTSRESQCDPCKIIQECMASTPDKSQENDNAVINSNVYTEKVSACGIPNCPHSRLVCTKVDKNFKSRQIKPACGSVNCPFAKQIIGTANEDDMLSLQYLSLKPEATCGKYTSPYKVPNEVPLPPIHWDCPEPLPEGNCRNPDCPFLPEILRKLKPKSIIDEILKSDIKESCGNPCCPYCCYPPTPPCGNPACPCCVSPPLCNSPPPSPCKVQSPAPYQPPPPLAYKMGKPCGCNLEARASPPPCGNPLCPNNNSNQLENSKITCPNIECPNKSDNESEQPEVTLPPKVYDDEIPCQPRQNASGAYDPCRNPNCRFAKVDNVCINPKCVYNKTAIEDTWCGDTACYLDSKYFEKGEEDFCKQLICPRISFTGFLYK